MTAKEYTGAEAQLAVLQEIYHKEKRDRRKAAAGLLREWRRELQRVCLIKPENPRRAGLTHGLEWRIDKFRAFWRENL